MPRSSRSTLLAAALVVTLSGPAGPLFSSISVTAAAAGGG